VLLLRLLAVLAVATIGVSALGYLFTGDRRYLGFAWRVTKLAILAAVLVLLLFAVERVFVTVPW
jgi:hypothetical protein